MRIKAQLSTGPGFRGLWAPTVISAFMDLFHDYLTVKIRLKGRFIEISTANAKASLDRLSLLTCLALSPCVLSPYPPWLRYVLSRHVHD